MSIQYRDKKKKKNSQDSRVTLDALHKKKVKELTDTINSLPELEKKLDAMKNNRYKLMCLNNGFGIIEAESGKKLYLLNKEISLLEKKIRIIKAGDLHNEYYKKTAHLLYSYYDNIQSVAQRHKKPLTSKKIRNYPKTSKKNILDFFNINVQEAKSNKELNRADLLEEYTKEVNPQSYQPTHNYVKTEIDMCPKCEMEMSLIQSEGLIVCSQCGREEPIIIDSEKPSYKDPPPEAGEFTYKRINRFEEWLTQYQAKETTEIPKEVLDKILVEIEKDRIKNLCQLTMEKVRAYLKKLKLHKYYEHVPHIICCLNGLPTPRLTPEIEEKLRSMFRQIQDIFDQVCPDNRTNFLSYSYLLRKLLELLGEDEHKQYFRLHKSREKIYQHDKVWQKICRKLNWEYIRTI